MQPVRASHDLGLDFTSACGAHGDAAHAGGPDAHRGLMGPPSPPPRCFSLGAGAPLCLDGGFAGGDATGLPQGLLPEAPKNGDRPDLGSSVALMQPAFRGSASRPVTAPTGAARCEASPRAAAAAPAAALAAVPASPAAPPAGPGASPPRALVRRSGAAPLGGHVVVAWGPLAGPPATPTNRDRPDLQSSVSLMTASFRGSAMDARLAPGVLAGSPAAAPPEAGPLPGQMLATPAGGRPQTAPGLQARRVVVRPLGAAPLAGAANEAAGVAMATPTNSDRKIMMARSSRSIRGSVLAARKVPAGAVPAWPDEAQGQEKEESSFGGDPCEDGAGASPRPFGSDMDAVGGSPPTASQARLRNMAPSLEKGHLGAGCAFWDAGPLATPTNGDRRDLRSSLAMGAPAFRGSAAAMGTCAAAAPYLHRGPAALGAACSPAGVPGVVVGRTPVGGVRGFPRL